MQQDHSGCDTLSTGKLPTKAENYPIRTGNSGSMLQHLMDARNLDKSDLVTIIGTETEVEEILAGQRAIAIDEARKLSDFSELILVCFSNHHSCIARSLLINISVSPSALNWLFDKSSPELSRTFTTVSNK